jgi:glutathione S-transferase
VPLTSIQFIANVSFIPGGSVSRTALPVKVPDMAGQMTLHWSPRSPYVRKVMIAVHEMGLQDRIRIVRTVAGGTTPHWELMKRNPVGKIPTLELEDGTAIYDSPVIIEYLDTLHTGPKLYPAAWPERLVALRRHALGQGMLDSALPLLGEGFRPPE